MKLKKIFASLLLAVALCVPAFCTDTTNTTNNPQLYTTAVASENPVGVVYFASNVTDHTVCMYFTVETANNVTGEVPTRIQLESGQTDVYVGRYNRYNQYQAWRSDISWKAFAGACN